MKTLFVALFLSLLISFPVQAQNEQGYITLQLERGSDEKVTMTFSDQEYQRLQNDHPAQSTAGNNSLTKTADLYTFNGLWGYRLADSHRVVIITKGSIALAEHQKRLDLVCHSGPQVQSTPLTRAMNFGAGFSTPPPNIMLATSSYAYRPEKMLYVDKSPTPVPQYDSITPQLKPAPTVYPVGGKEVIEFGEFLKLFLINYFLLVILLKFFLRPQITAIGRALTWGRIQLSRPFIWVWGGLTQASQRIFNTEQRRMTWQLIVQAHNQDLERKKLEHQVAMERLRLEKDSLRERHEGTEALKEAVNEDEVSKHKAQIARRAEEVAQLKLRATRLIADLEYTEKLAQLQLEGLKRDGTYDAIKADIKLNKLKCAAILAAQQLRENPSGSAADNAYRGDDASDGLSSTLY